MPEIWRGQRLGCERSASAERTVQGDRRQHRRHACGDHPSRSAPTGLPAEQAYDLGICPAALSEMACVGSLASRNSNSAPHVGMPAKR